MKRIATLIIFCFTVTLVFGQANSKSNSTKTGNLQETSKSKSASKIYERGGKNFTVTPADRINTLKNEYYVTSYKDGIVYSVINKVGTPANSNDVSFYFSKVLNGQTGNPVKFDHNYTGEFIPIAASFNKSGQQIFLTCLEPASAPSNKDKIERYHILSSDFKNGIWADYKELSFSKNIESAGFPVINSSNNLIYFSGKQKGNNTGFDIFSVNKSKDWGSPKKLGSSVNTEKDEIMPTLYNNTLFFASNGRGGQGHFDLFLIDMAKSGAESFILDTPLSSSNNDILILLSDDNRSGYLINDTKRKSTGDILMFSLNGSENFIK